MDIRKTIKSIINQVLGRSEPQLDVKPWRNYRHLEYGTRLDDLLFIPLLGMSYTPYILTVFGYIMHPFLNVIVLIGSVAFFVFGSLVKTTWLADRVKAKYYLKTLIRFERGETRSFQWDFAKRKDQKTFYRLDPARYQQLEIKPETSEKDQKTSKSNKAADTNQPIDKEQWIPYIFERKPLPAIILFPCKHGELEFVEGNVVEAGQTTNGARAEATLYHVCRSTLPNEVLSPVPVDVFTVVECEYHFERGQPFKDMNIDSDDLGKTLKSVDEGTSIPLLSALKQQEIERRDLNRQLDDAEWDATKRADRLYKKKMQALDEVRPRSEVKEDYVKWIVILVGIVLAFIIGARVVGLIPA